MKKYIPLLITTVISAVLATLITKSGNVFLLVGVQFFILALIFIVVSLFIAGIKFLIKKSFSWEQVLKTAFIISVVYIIIQIVHIGLQFMRQNE